MSWTPGTRSGEKQAQACYRRALLGILLLGFLWSNSSHLFAQLITPDPAVLDEALNESLAGRGLVYVIPIHDAIEPGLLHMVRRGIKMARDDKAGLLMLDMDTPGGRVDSAVEIKNLLLDVRQVMKTATFAHPEAISAGALLALSTEKIYMTENGLIGDAAPVSLMPGGGITGEDETPEKVLSYVRQQFISAAELVRHSTQAAAAMVDKDHAFPPYSKEGELLTLSAKNAVECGLAEKIVPDLNSAIAAAGFGKAEQRFVAETWSESIARFLTNPVITGILMTVGILAIGIEFYTPGIGYPALIGALCFVIIFWGHSVAGLAGYETFLIFIVGVVLLGIEIFLIPGFGVVGVTGLALIFVSLILAVSDRLPPSHELFNLSDLIQPLIQVCLSFLLGLGGIIAFAAVAPQTGPFRRRMILTTQSLGTEESSQPSFAGRQGIAASDLRPSGTALFGDDRVSVVTEGEYIEKGTVIRVLRMEGPRIIVERA
jgi:membrane-bound serine protease (ClpP class)